MSGTDEISQTTVNDSGTPAAADTNLTQPRSGFELEDARRYLIAKREAAGADSEIGHRCSNLIEMLENFRTAEGEQKVHLAKSIHRTMTELAIRHQ